MQVKIVDDLHTVSWHYSHPEINALMEQKNITREDVRKMKNKTELAHALGLDSLPLPTHTECVIRNQNGDEIAEAQVSKHANDPYDKNAARKYSLKKALDQLFPAQDNLSHKAPRRDFWNTYLHRGPSQEEKTFMRLLKKYAGAEVNVAPAI